MATQSEAKRERSVAALQAAIRAHKGDSFVSPFTILVTAEKFLEWLEEKA